MSKTSERIRYARTACRLTVRELADFIGTSERTVIRYENGQSVPDTRSLKQLATIFDLSTDYLLGLSDNAETSFLAPYRSQNLFYRKVQQNEILPDTEYYVIEYDPGKEFYPMSGQMEWVGRAGGRDLYALRPVIPEGWLFLLNEIGEEKPLILNCREDFYVFLNYGGSALATEAVCKECVPHMMRPGYVTPPQEIPPVK